MSTINCGPLAHAIQLLSKWAFLRKAMTFSWTMHCSFSHFNWKKVFYQVFYHVPTHVTLWKCDSICFNPMLLSWWVDMSYFNNFELHAGWIWWINYCIIHTIVDIYARKKYRIQSLPQNVNKQSSPGLVSCIIGKIYKSSYASASQKYIRKNYILCLSHKSRVGSDV